MPVSGGGAEELLERSIDLDPGAVSRSGSLDLTGSRPSARSEVRRGHRCKRALKPVPTRTSSIWRSQKRLEELETRRSNGRSSRRPQRRGRMTFVVTIDSGFRTTERSSGTRRRDRWTSPREQRRTTGPPGSISGSRPRNAYRFDAAERAFKRALVADPEDDGYRRHYDRFLVRLKNG